mmetsp:Transcript_3989/g.9092  ORF Transcript_3989/g.9092 Transcript_3989/m.9092 type:complete len:84 (+) Transcript_3989:789-1040(+)
MTSVDEAYFVQGGPMQGEKCRVTFDVLLPAEGEWSPCTRALGFGKTIDKFGLALGLVINLCYDKQCPAEKKTKSIVSTATDIA